MKPLKIAWFISPHGFGHAARSSAVMEAIARIDPEVGFELFTTVPKWFFEASLSAPFTYHSRACDIGLVQRSSFEEDLAATAKLLDERDLLSEQTVADVARTITDSGCAAVVADIAPQGLAAARRAGLPSVLIENFTWSWIYEHSTPRPAALERWSERFRSEFESSSLRLQAEHCCHPVNGALRIPPISREPGTSRAATREALGISSSRPMVLVSMGGIPWHFSEAELTGDNDITVVLPGAGSAHQRRGSAILLPHHSRFHHPDLVHASDGVVAKLGYSTVAEVWAAGVPLGWIGRPTFPESPVMARWVRREMQNIEITTEELTAGAWIHRLEAVVERGRTAERRRSGALEAARAIVERVIKKSP